MSEIASDSDLNDGQQLEDLDSCLGYLKKREVFLYKMMNDPNHKAMLYFLEVLLNSDHQQTIEDLTDKFFCKNFTQDMRAACGNNAHGLKQFLERYPSLFQVKGNIVSAVAIEMPNSVSTFSNCSSPSLTATSRNYSSVNESMNNDNVEMDIDGSKKGLISYPYSGKLDINLETEAVKFFQIKLMKRDEKWVVIKSLAGHLSQASQNIRQIVGPQLEFKQFLIRHPHVFEIQGELVSLKDTFPAHFLTRKLKPSIQPTNINGIKPISKINRPKSLNVSGPELPINNRLESFSAASAPTTPVAHNNGFHILARSAPLSMTSNEYRAIMFLRKVIEKKNGSLSLSHLFLYLGKASETIRNVIGWTKFELQEFIRKNCVFFDITPNEIVVNRKANRINVIITATNNTTDTGTRTLTNRCGKVFHVAKLWGIIDLGKHEHVFFDKSIFKHLDDLQRHFKIGEFLYFNAILAPKESRAKWRATQVWKESDREMVEKFSGNIMSRTTTICGINNDVISDVNSIITNTSDQGLQDDSLYGSDDQKLLPDDIEKEITRILNITRTDDEYEEQNLEFNKWNKKDILIDFSKPFKNQAGGFYDSGSDVEDESICSIPTPDFSSQQSIHSEPSVASHPLSAPAATSAHYSILQANTSNRRNDLSKVSNDLNSRPAQELKKSNSVRYKRPKMANIATQTLSTGDIMATNLFHEGMNDKA